MNIQSQSEDRQAQKRATIMEAMNGLVHQYGYSKVTMDDIAKASGLSRPALYQFFRNKQEIYRALAGQVCRASLDAAREAIAGDGPAPDRLVQAIIVGKLNLLAEMESTRHGAELLDLGNELSSDLFEEFLSGLQSVVTELFREVVSKEHRFGAESLAASLVFWLEGMKGQVKDPAKRESLLRDFVAMQFAALERQ